MFGIGIPPVGLLLLVLTGFIIATTVNTFAMESAVLFVPAFLFVVPVIVSGFPDLPANAAVGLALFVGLFGYSSSVPAYWYRHQIDFNIAARLLVITVPTAVVARVASYYAPDDLLMLGFGGLLVLLAIVLFESHEHGPSVVGLVVKKPEMSFLSAVLDEAYEPRTRVCQNTHNAPETPPAESLGGPADSPDYRSNGRAIFGDRDDATDFHLEVFDAVVTLLGGALAGLVGIAIGELTQAMLTLRRRVPLHLSTGTAAIVLHVTIVSALVTNLILLEFASSITGEGFTVPFGPGIFVATGCLFGGQMGAYLNNHLSEHTVMRMLIIMYFFLGAFVLGRVLFFSGTGH